MAGGVIELLPKQPNLQGEYDLAIQTFEASLEIAAEIGQPSYLIAGWMGWEMFYASLAQQDYRYAELASQAGDEKAVQRFQQDADRYDSKAVNYFEASLRLSEDEAVTE